MRADKGVLHETGIVTHTHRRVVTYSKAIALKYGLPYFEELSEVEMLNRQLAEMKCQLTTLKLQNRALWDGVTERRKSD